MKSLVSLLSRGKSLERKSSEELEKSPNRDTYDGLKAASVPEEAEQSYGSYRTSHRDDRHRQHRAGGKFSGDSAYVRSSDQRSNSTQRSQEESGTAPGSLGTDSLKALPAVYRASFDTAKAASSLDHASPGGSTTSFRLDSGLASNVSSLEALERRDLDHVMSQSGARAPRANPASPVEIHPSESFQGQRRSRDSETETSSAHSRRSSFALERASFESNRASLDKFLSRSDQPAVHLPVPQVQNPQALCETLRIPQVMWARFLALAVVPADTPLPMSMLQRLWALKSRSDAEATANMLEQLGVMKVACLADSTAWALVQPGHLKALHSVVAKDMAATHMRLIEAYKEPGVASLADVTDDGYIMQNVCHHLVHTHSMRELRQLLMRPAWLECKLHSYGMAAVVADFRRYLMVEPDDGIKLLLEAFQMSVSACLAHPSVAMLHAQLTGRLMLVRKTIQMDAAKLRTTPRSKAADAVCLKTRTPSLEQAGGLQRMALRGHTGGVKKVLLAPGGIDVITSSTDGTSRVWDMEIGDCVLLLEGHSAPLTDMATAANGSVVITASEDGTARVWDLEEGQCLNVLVGHSCAVNSVAVDRYGKFAVTAGADGTGRVWDLATGSCVQLLLGHTSLGALHKVALTRDGSRAITCSSDFTARAWEVFSGNCVHVFSGHTGWVVDAVLTLDSSLLVTASHDSTARVWDMLSGRCVHVLGGHAGRINAVRVANDNKTVITVSDDYTAKVFDLQTGRAMHTLEGHGGWVSDCAITAASDTAITVSGDDLAVVWDILSGGCKNVLEGHTGEVLSVMLTKRGRFAVTGSMDGTARIWDLAAGSSHVQRAHAGRVHGIVATPDASIVTSYGDDGCLVWDVVEGACTASLEGPAVRWAACLEDGRHLLCASGDRTSTLWDLSTSTSSVAIPGSRGSRVKSWAASQDGRVAVVVLFDSTVTVWDLEKQEPLTVLQRWGQRDAALGHTGGVNAAYVTRDGGRALTVSKDCTARIWHMASGASLHLLQGHTDGVTGAVFSNDGSAAVTLAYDNTARLWDVDSGVCLGVLPHTGAVTRATFSADDRLLLTASTDHMGMLWGCETGHRPRLLHLLKGHKEEVTGVAISPDNRWAATCSRDNSLHLWNATTGRAAGLFISDAWLSCCVFAGSTLFAGDDSGNVHLLALPES